VKNVPEVLFVCVHNAGRSQLAAGLPHHHAAGAVHVRSAAPRRKRYLDWGLDDPAGRGHRRGTPVRDEIDRRIRALLAELLGTTTSS
jgi:protein-tyrosine-phosphatase